MITQGMRALIVDDDPFVREMLAMIMQGAGFDAEMAESGEDAQVKLGGGAPFELIVSDMNMPGMSGLDLIKKIRSEGNNVPVIILTGNNEISVAIEAIRSGANDYLLKDENIQDTIILSTERVLDQHQMKLQNIRLMQELAARNARMEKDRVLANKVQKSILPQSLGFPGFEIGTFYCASDQIGGDFFDAWETKSRIQIIIGDISGHSTSSALMMAVCKGMFNSLGQTIDDPREIVTMANKKLSEIMGDSGMFLSMVFASYKKDEGVLEVLSAGHNPVYLLKPEGILTLESTGAVLGWDADDTWEVLRHPFASGDALFLYTDGLTEAKNASDEEFGEDFLKAINYGEASPAALVDAVFQKVNSFAGGAFADDLTMFVFKKS